MEQLRRRSPHIVLTAGDLRQLGRGPVDQRLVETLRDAQVSRALLLLRHLATIEPGLQVGAQRLAEAATAAPHPVRELLAYPWLAVWTAQSVRADGPIRPSHLNGLALAASARAGLDVRLELAAVGGRLIVPGYGSRGVSGARALVSSAELADPQWIRPWRFKLSGHTKLSITVDDYDPERDCYDLAVTARLDDDAHASIRSNFANAWALLGRYVPRYAEELAAGMTTFVPLSADGMSRHSVTHSDAFGAFASEPNVDPIELAVAMLHEFQHSKLSVVMHMTDLCDPNDRGRYPSPWRRDLRPITGLLHGAYAFSAVADFWAALRAEPDLADLATTRVAEVRAQIDRALLELRRANSLTPAGRVLCECLAERNATATRG